MNKVLIKLYVPKLGTSYELFVPDDKTILECLPSIEKAIKDLSDDYFVPTNTSILVNSETGILYDMEKTLFSLHIENGTIITLI